MRVRPSLTRVLLFWLAFVAAGLLIAASPWQGQQGRDQSAVPALLLVRFRLYGKVSVVY